MTHLGCGSDWTLVTVTYNSVHQLRSFWGTAAYGAARWIVVDNASEDGSADVAAELGAHVIRLASNVGFGAANNLALAATTTPWVAFVNPDVVVGTPADLGRLAAVSHANGGLVAPQLMNPDGTEQPNARGVPYLADKVANRAGRFPGDRPDAYVRTGLLRPTYCAWVIGAALAGPTDTFRTLGGWDERYFIYYEDHDMGLRSWAAGHPVVLDPEVRWMHEWQRATTRIRLAPWMHELRAGRQFYARYPDLLGRRRRSSMPTLLTERLWQPAQEPVDA